MVEKFDLFSSFKHFTHNVSCFFNGFLQTVPQVYVIPYYKLIEFEFHNIHALKEDVTVSYALNV